MEIKSEIKNNAYSIKIVAEENGEVAGSVYLYVLKNDYHEKPFGMIEYLFVEEKFRRAGVGTKLMMTLIDKAKELDCYKIIGNSRQEREKVHEFYRKLGFSEYGLEFRMDIK